MVTDAIPPSLRPRWASTFGDTEGKKTIVLLGDSHAGMWFPAFDTLAKNAHMKLVLLMKAV